MFAKKLLLLLAALLLLLMPSLAQASEQYRVVTGDTVEWISGTMTGNRFAYFRLKEIKLIHNGQPVKLTNVKRLNRIVPGDILEFERTDSKRVEVPNQTIPDICQNYAMNQQYCQSELAYRNHRNLTDILSGVYIPLSYRTVKSAEPKKEGVQGGGPKKDPSPVNTNSLFTLKVIVGSMMFIIIFLIAWLAGREWYRNRKQKGSQQQLLKHDTTLARRMINHVDSLVFVTYILFRQLPERFTRQRLRSILRKRRSKLPPKISQQTMEVFRSILSDELRRHSRLNFFPMWRIGSRYLEVQSASDLVTQLVGALHKVATTSPGIDFQVNSSVSSVNVEDSGIDRVRVYPKGLEHWQPSMDMREYLALRKIMLDFAKQVASNFAGTYTEYPLTFHFNPNPDVGIVDLVITGDKPGGVPDVSRWEADMTQTMGHIVQDISEDFQLLNVSGSGSTATFRFQHHPIKVERFTHYESSGARNGTDRGTVVSILSTRRASP